MCRKLLLLIAVLGLVGTVWADDPCAPNGENVPWVRGDAGTTYAEFTYDTDIPTGDPGWPIYAPKSSWWVPKEPPHDEVIVENYVERALEDGWVAHWEEGVAWSGSTWVEESTWVEGQYDMPMSHYETHALQLWSADPVWHATHLGRTGVLEFPAGSWDIFNFPSMQVKYIQLQITWQPWNRGDVITFGVELESSAFEALHWEEDVWWETAGWNYAEGDWEGPLSEAPEGFDPWETWLEGGWQEGSWEGPATWYAWGGYESSWWRAAGGWEEDSGWIGGEEPVEQEMLEWWDGELVPISEVGAGGDWRTSVFLFYMDWNPVVEYLGIFPQMWDEELEEYVDAVIALDQAVIDTICIPEPATIALLGLGGLALIRRKKR